MTFSDGTLPAFDSHHNNAAQGHNPAHSGCSFPDCGTQQTEFLDSRHGRRCRDHPVVSCPMCGGSFDPRTTYAGERHPGGPDRGYCSPRCRYDAHNARNLGRPRSGRPSQTVDEIAIERAANGDLSITLNGRELAAAWAICERRGLSAPAIADRLGITARTVVRWRNGHATPTCSRPGRAA